MVSCCGIQADIKVGDPVRWRRGFRGNGAPRVMLRLTVTGLHDETIDLSYTDSEGAPQSFGAVPLAFIIPYLTPEQLQPGSRLMWDKRELDGTRRFVSVTVVGPAEDGEKVRVNWLRRDTTEPLERVVHPDYLYLYETVRYHRIDVNAAPRQESPSGNRGTRTAGPQTAQASASASGKLVRQVLDMLLLMGPALRELVEPKMPELTEQLMAAETHLREFLPPRR